MRKGLFRTIFALSFLYGGWALFHLMGSLLQEIPMIFANVYPYWPGYLYYLAVASLPFLLLEVGFFPGPRRKALVKGWGLALLLLAFASIAGLCLETSLGSLPWTMGGFAPLYPLETLIGSFVLLLLGSACYFQKPRFFTAMDPLVSKRSLFQRWPLKAYLFLAMVFVGSFLNGFVYFDPASVSLLVSFGVIGFYGYLLCPSVFLLLFLFRHEGKVIPVSLAWINLGVGLFLALWRWVILFLDPTYLALGAPVLLPFDLMSRFPLGTILLFFLNVLAPLSFLLLGFFHRRGEKTPSFASNPDERP